MKRNLSIVTIFLIMIVLAGFSGSAKAGIQQATMAATQATAPSDPLGGATTFAKADKPTSVTVMLDYTPNTNHLGIFVAQALGYYKDANLTVDIQQPGDVQVEQL